MFICKRNLRSVDNCSLVQDIKQCLDPSMTFTAEQLDSILRSLLDKHVPITSCKLSEKKCAPWYNTISDALRTAKISHHKADRRWRSSGLTVDKEIYDSTKKAVTKIVNSAKCSYYSDKIAESSNTKQLFSITDKLMARNNLTPLPTKHHLNELPELFSNFFCNKVQTIRDHLDKHLPVTNQDSSYTYNNRFSGCPFNSFTPISENSLQKIIL